MLSAFDAKQDGGISQVDMGTTANAGSFNNWSQPLVLGRSPETSDLVRSLSLPPGTCQVGLRWPAEHTDVSRNPYPAMLQLVLCVANLACMPYLLMCVAACSDSPCIRLAVQIPDRRPVADQCC